MVGPVDPGLRVLGQADHDRLDPDHIARAWVELMKRLGYTRYVAQGGDWGAIITDLMGAQAPRADRYPLQHAGHRPTRDLKLLVGSARATAAGRPVSRGEAAPTTS